MLEILFKRLQRYQSVVASPFKIRCDKTVLRIGRIVLPECASCLEASLFNGVLDVPPLVRLFLIKGV